MRRRRWLIALVATTAPVLSLGLFAAPAAAVGNSTVTASVDVTSAVYPGSASDTATVTGDVNSTPGGTLTYTFFTGIDCLSPGTAAGTVVVTANGPAPASETEGPLAAGSYSFDATYNGDGVNDPSVPVCESFTIGQATTTPPSITNLPMSGTFGGIGFTAIVGGTNSDGVKFVTSNSMGVCTVNGLIVTYVGGGTCSLTAGVMASTNYPAASGTAQTFPVLPATPTAPSITNLPTGGTYGQPSFKATVSGTSSTGTLSVTSNSPTVCTVGPDGLTVSYVGAGTCSLSAEVAPTPDYLAASGTPQTFVIGRATPSTPTVTNIPTNAVEFAGFTATWARPVTARPTSPPRRLAPAPSAPTG